MKLTGIILAGGKSSRMGQDKGLMQFRDKQMVQYSIELLQQFTNRILISSNNPEYNKFNLPVISDIYKDCGPISGLHAAISASQTNWNIVISCDAPFLNAKLFQFMLSLRNDQDAIIPKHKNGIEPLFGIYSKTILPRISEKISKENYKLQNLLTQSKVSFFDVSDLINAHPLLFSNLNSPEDLL